jgi:chorismate mutase / prephenate dehydratase
MTAKPDTSLDAIRREIDAIDDGLLELLARRFQASAKVRASKRTAGSLAISPLRPAREAMMLRRLVVRGRNDLAPELLVRLWRVILSASTQAQAAITIHVDSNLAADVGKRVKIAEHFSGMPVETHYDTTACLSALITRSGDLAILPSNSAWADWVSSNKGGGVAVIGTLPVISDGSAPDLLIFGHAEAQPSGQDETIILSRMALPAVNRWELRSGKWFVTSKAGFLMASEVECGGDECLIAGQCPTSLEVNS